MNANRKSDDFIVPTKRANKAGTPVAEFVEGRRSPKGSEVLFVFTPDTEPDHVIMTANELPRLVAMFAIVTVTPNGRAV